MVHKSELVKFLCLVMVALCVESKPAPSDLDSGNACVAQYLKAKGKLRQDFPMPADVNSVLCLMVVPVIKQTLDRVLCKKLSDHESIEAECVIDELRKADTIDNLLKQEIIQMSKALDEEEAQRSLQEGKESLRKIFEHAAVACDSDPTYAGEFDDVLEVKNESLAVLQQNYCLTKFVVESKLIEVENLDFNPKRIVTSDIDCLALIKNNRMEREKKLLTALKARNLTEEQTQCIKDKFQIHRAFDSNLAFEVIEQIDVSLQVKRENREKVAKKLEVFIKSVFICDGTSSMQHKPGDKHASIMQF